MKRGNVHDVDSPTNQIKLEGCLNIFQGMGIWACCLSMYLCWFSIVFIIWGSISASSYVEYQNIRNSHTNTTCLLLNYTVRENKCQTCGNYGYFSYTCFDEQFLLLYSIFNGRDVTSVYRSFGNSRMHDQRQIGNNYTCFYQWKQVTSVTLDLADEESELIQLYIASGLTGLFLLIMITGLVYHLAIKIGCSCSCLSIFGTSIKNIYAPIQTKKNREQATINRELHRSVYV